VTLKQLIDLIIKAQDKSGPDLSSYKVVIYQSSLEADMGNWSEATRFEVNHFDQEVLIGES